MHISRAAFLFLFAAAFFAAPHDADATRHRHHHHYIAYNPPSSAIVVDADTGKVIYASKPNEVRHPASLTKMMTLYLTFEALEKNQISMSTRMPVSDYAARQAPTNLDMMAGDSLRVEDAIKALVVRSANDAAVVLAEYLGGSETGFASRMTAKAHALGMHQTYFHNASGLPDVRQVTTARDLAVLGMALRKHFPQYYDFFNTREFTLNGVTYTTHNHVMQRYEYADGIKTGYVRMSGYNLVTSAKKDGHSLVGVVIGGSTVRERDDRMIALLDDAFDTMNSKPDFKSVAVLVKVPSIKTVRDITPDTGVVDVASLTPSSGTTVVPGMNTEADAESVAEGDTSSDSGRMNWGVQVGLFGASKDAQTAAEQAKKLASQELAGATVKVVEDRVGRAAVARARIENLTQEQAQNACRHLAVQRESCYAYRVGSL